MRVLAVVPARGGSKSIPRKNVKHFAGKPLLAWTIEAALQVTKITRVIVSTDDPEIAETGRLHGAEVPFIRPSELAEDDTAGVCTLLHAMHKLPDFDAVLLLQPTSPLRSSEDISGIIDLAIERNANSIVSVCRVSKHPHWMYQIEQSGTLIPFCAGESASSRRQDLPIVYSLNGAVYFARTGWLSQTKALLDHTTLAYVMPEERSIDIDTLFDWRLAECMMEMKYDS